MENIIQVNKDICFECGTESNIQMHHVVPKAKGGKNTIPLCQICHSKVHGEHMLKIQKLAWESRHKDIKMKKELGIPHQYGRPVGTKESIDKFLLKPKNQKIMELLQKKINYITIQDMLNVSPKTISKVRKAMKNGKGSRSFK